MAIYVHHNGQQLGPFTEEQLKAQLASGTISVRDYAWWDGQKDWLPLSQTPYGGLPPGAQVMPGTAAAANYPVGMTAPTSQLAIWALVCGCLGFVFSLLASIPAIILGHMALNETKRNPALQGRGMALAGTILGYFFTLLLPLISIIAISVLIALGNQVKDTFKTINAQLKEAEMTNNAPANSQSPDQTTNSAPDNSTNSAPGK